MHFYVSGIIVKVSKKGGGGKKSNITVSYSAWHLIINCYYLSSFQSGPACAVRVLKCVALGMLLLIRHEHCSAVSHADRS